MEGMIKIELKFSDEGQIKTKSIPLSVNFKQLIIFIILFKLLLQRENNLPMLRNHNNDYLFRFLNFQTNVK